MLTGINLVLAVLAFTALSCWLLRRRGRLQSTSLDLKHDSPAD